MAKISIVPWTSRIRPDGTVPLYLVVRSKKQRSIISLNVSLHPRNWNEGKQEVRKTYREYRKLNKHLRDVIEQAESAVLKILSRVFLGNFLILLYSKTLALTGFRNIPHLISCPEAVLYSKY